METATLTRSTGAVAPNLGINETEPVPGNPTAKLEPLTDRLGVSPLTNGLGIDPTRVGHC